MKWRNFKAPDINLPIGSVEVAALGSGMGTIKRTKNAMANTAIAVYITGNIWEIVAFSMEPAIRIPTNIGVMVAITELKEPPTWISWFPLLPSPPSLFSIGLTTVLSKHMEKPAMKAPIKYTAKAISGLEWPDKYWIPTPIKPTATAINAVFLYPTRCSKMPLGIPITAYAIKLPKLPNIPKALDTENWFFSTIPIGAARLVTNEIIPKRKIIVIIAMSLPFCFCCVMVL